MRSFNGAQLRNTFGHSWTVPMQVAAVMFLTLMACGAALLLAGKLQFPSLGSGANPFDVLRAIGLLALASFGITLEVGDLPLSVVPLGVSAATCFTAVRVWSEAERSKSDPMPIASLKAGAIFGVLCLVGALVFRFGGDVPVRASLFSAAGTGLVQGWILSGVALAIARRKQGGSQQVWVSGPLPLAAVRSVRKLVVYSAIGSVIALLCLVIGRLASAPLPSWFGLGDALAALIYLVAFLPNVLVSIFALSVGATLEIGAQVNAGGRVVGPLLEHSIFEWGRGDAHSGLLLLVLLPLSVTVLAGYKMEPDRSLRENAVAIGVASLLFAIVLAVLAGVADARLGAGLVKEAGVGLIAVDVAQTWLFTLLWASAGATLGRVVRERKHEEVLAKA